MRRIGKFKKSSIILILLLMFIRLVLSACTSMKMNKYYTEKSNYRIHYCPKISRRRICNADCGYIGKRRGTIGI